MVCSPRLCIILVYVVENPKGNDYNKYKYKHPPLTCRRLFTATRRLYLWQTKFLPEHRVACYRLATVSAFLLLHYRLLHYRQISQLHYRNLFCYIIGRFCYIIS